MKENKGFCIAFISLMVVLIVTPMLGVIGVVFGPETPKHGIADSALVTQACEECGETMWLCPKCDDNWSRQQSEKWSHISSEKCETCDVKDPI